ARGFAGARDDGAGWGAVGGRVASGDRAVGAPALRPRARIAIAVPRLLPELVAAHRQAPLAPPARPRVIGGRDRDRDRGERETELAKPAAGDAEQHLER